MPLSLGLCKRKRVFLQRKKHVVSSLLLCHVFQAVPKIQATLTICAKYLKLANSTHYSNHDKPRHKTIRVYYILAQLDLDKTVLQVLRVFTVPLNYHNMVHSGHSRATYLTAVDVTQTKYVIIFIENRMKQTVD